MKRFFAGLTIVFLLVSLAASFAFADDDIVVMEEGKLPYELNTWMVRTVCANGYVFFVSYVLARQSGAGIHSIQVMEERDGKVVPMRCDAKKYKKSQPQQTPQPAQQPPPQQQPGAGN